MHDLLNLAAAVVAVVVVAAAAAVADVCCGREYLQCIGVEAGYRLTLAPVYPDCAAMSLLPADLQFSSAAGRNSIVVDVLQMERCY